MKTTMSDHKRRDRILIHATGLALLGALIATVILFSGSGNDTARTTDVVADQLTATGEDDSSSLRNAGDIDEASLRKDEVPVITTEHCRTLDTGLNYYCPVVRYCPFSHYNDLERLWLLTNLGYDENSWNTLANNANENTDFGSLTVDVQNSHAELGYDEDRHDCCQGHYYSYGWSDFTDNDGYEGVLAALALWGYDQNSWDNDLPVDNNDLGWDELPVAVRDALYDNMCLTRETWDGVPALPDWPTIEDGLLYPGSFEATPAPTEDAATTPAPTLSSAPSPALSSAPSPSPTLSSAPSPPPADVVSTPAPTVATTPAPTASSGSTITTEHCRTLDTATYEYYCPVVRYCEWDHYSLRERIFLETRLGYEQTSWNVLETNARETTVFGSLTENAQGAYADVGYDEDKHDCCNGHYYAYGWSDFTSDSSYQGVLDALALWGYDQNSWDNDLPVDNNNLAWDQLPATVRQALFDNMCLSRETWDGVPLVQWPANSMLYPGQYLRNGGVQTGAPEPAPIAAPVSTPSNPSPVFVGTPAPNAAPGGATTDALLTGVQEFLFCGNTLPFLGRSHNDALDHVDDVLWSSAGARDQHKAFTTLLREAAGLCGDDPSCFDLLDDMVEGATDYVRREAQQRGERGRALAFDDDAALGSHVLDAVRDALRRVETELAAGHARARNSTTDDLARDVLYDVRASVDASLRELLRTAPAGDDAWRKDDERLLAAAVDVAGASAAYWHEAFVHRHVRERRRTTESSFLVRYHDADDPHQRFRSLGLIDCIFAGNSYVSDSSDSEDADADADADEVEDCEDTILPFFIVSIVRGVIRAVTADVFGLLFGIVISRACGGASLASAFLFSGLYALCFAFK